MQQQGSGWAEAVTPRPSALGAAELLGSAGYDTRVVIDSGRSAAAVSCRAAAGALKVTADGAAVRIRIDRCAHLRHAVFGRISIGVVAAVGGCRKQDRDGRCFAVRTEWRILPFYRSAEIVKRA